MYADLDSYIDRLMKPSEPGIPIAAVVHNNSLMGIGIAGRLSEVGFNPILFNGGDSFVKYWSSRKQTVAVGITSLFIHKDIGGKDRLTAFDVVDHIRNWSEGESMRTIVVSGEFSYKDVCKEAKEQIRADAGYDPTNMDDGYLPEWVVKFIKLGPVSSEEAEHFRGRNVVRNSEGVKTRIAWLDKLDRRGKEREC